jgi:AcrR family transcriptional regulator
MNRIESRSVTKRKYHQSLRAESAERTRERILDGLASRLRAQPSSPVSVESVAEDAGVARSTIYTVFGDRAGLYDALARHLVQRSPYDRLIEATRLPDPRETIREGFRVGVEMFAADREIWRAMYSLARLRDPAISEAIARIEQERAGGMAGLARRLAARGYLRDGLGATRASHLLWVLTSFDTFDLLYTDRKQDLAAVTDLLVETAERTLLKRA